MWPHALVQSPQSTAMSGIRRQAVPMRSERHSTAHPLQQVAGCSCSAPFAEAILLHLLASNDNHGTDLSQKIAAERGLNNGNRAA